MYELLKVVLHWQLVFMDHLQVVSKHMRCYSVSNVVVPRMEEDISVTHSVYLCFVLLSELGHFGLLSQNYQSLGSWSALIENRYNS